MTRSIHDNRVLGYEVDVRMRSLVLSTEFTEHGEHERTDVVFTDVLGYHLFDALGGILFAIEPIDLADLVRKEATLFADGAKYGWPFKGCSGDPVAFAESRGMRAWRIDSSIGFDGFVVAKAMTLVPR